MKRILSSLAIWLGCICALPAQTPTVQHKEAFRLGESLTFSSNILNELRILNIYLPYGYDQDSTKEYPVIYLLDGSADEDFIHVAGLLQFATFPWVNMVSPSILVGIANVDRKRDFTYPTQNEDDLRAFPTTGGSAAFISSLEKEIRPLIEATYRTADTTTLIGQSLGGLLATEILFKQPKLFDSYVIISPSLWWDDESLLTYEPKTAAIDGEIYLAVGEEGAVMKRTAYELLTRLIKAEYRVHFDFLGDQDHGNIHHQAVYRAFERLWTTPNE